MVVSSYSFGRIVVKGKEYRSDVVITPGETVLPWWRKRGHEVCPEDLKIILEEEPEVIVFGTGYSGRMKIPGELIENLKKKGIDVVVQLTRDACDTFNRKYREKKTVAALHLTC